MKLSRFERALLYCISNAYPKPWDLSDSDKTIGMGERPLPTIMDLVSKFNGNTEDEIRASLVRLISFECVQTVYLYAPGDFSEVNLAPGITFRCPVSKKGEGVDGYQITVYGKETIQGFPSYRLKKFIWGIAESTIKG